ncbi:MAG: hypothetical protein JXR60_06810 [Bacteroidales bacterium]|nr:hypothetical protein [Bacteroidales bacterium]
MKKTSIILFLLILTLLWFPLLDNTFQFLQLKPLKGDFTKQKDLNISINAFFEESYQSPKETFLKESLNIYPFLIRFWNQIQFSLYKQTETFHVVIGKNNTIFDETYIDAYLGTDYIGDTLLNNVTDELSFFKQILNQFGKQLLVCIVPGKAGFYQDQFPDIYQNIKKRDTTNLTAYRQVLKQKEINYLDLTNYLIEFSKKNKNNFYPRNGIHLSTYATVLTADTLIKYIKSTYQKDIATIKINEISETTEAQYYDNDIEESLNLLFPLEKETLHYPSFEFIEGTENFKVTTIGDSFYKYIFDSGIHDKSFNKGKFWFYGKILWPDLNKADSINNNLIEEFLETDLYLIFTSDATLYKFPYNMEDRFIEPIGVLNQDLFRDFIVKRISNTPLWKKNIEANSITSNVSFDTQCQNEANYLFQYKIQNLDSHSKDIVNKYYQVIYNTQWNKAIKEKSEQNNTNFFVQALQDAKWVVDNSK